jgi:hypothetical protein
VLWARVSSRCWAGLAAVEEPNVGFRPIADVGRSGQRQNMLLHSVSPNRHLLNGPVSRALAATVAIALATACEGEVPQPEPRGQSVSVSTAAFSPDRPQLVQLSAELVSRVDGFLIAGTTNLPDGTLLNVALRRPRTVLDETVRVRGGAFASLLKPRKGVRVPPGAYEMVVSTPPGFLQPEHLKAQLGPDYQALKGPRVQNAGSGHVVQYAAQVSLGAASDYDARDEAVRQHEANARTNCSESPSLVERATGSPISPTERRDMIAGCLEDLAIARSAHGDAVSSSPGGEGAR